MPQAYCLCQNSRAECFSRHFFCALVIAYERIFYPSCISEDAYIWTEHQLKLA